jgi:hypothetical protein
MNLLKLNLFNGLLMDAANDVLTGGGAPPADKGDSSTPPPDDKKGAPPVEVKLPDNWREAIPSEFKDEPVLQRIQDFPSLVKSLVHAQKAIGANKVVVPSKHATPEDWTNFFQQVGVPKDAKDFKVELPKDATFDGEFLDAFKDAAHKANLLPTQAQALVDWFSKANAHKMTAIAEDRKTKDAGELQKLQAEWGAAFSTKAQQANIALSHFDPDGKMPAMLKELGLSNNAQLIRFLAKVGETLSEDKIAGQGGEPALTPKEAQGELNKIYGDMKHPYWLKEHPGHKAAVEEVQKLTHYMKPA